MAQKCLVLWPSLLPLQDSCGSYVYGWTQPLLCVAGVIKADTPEHANDLLREVMDEQGWNTIQRKCGTLARVFGLIRRCELDERKGRVVVQLLDASELDYTITHYDPPNLRSLEIYTCDFHIYAAPSRLTKPNYDHVCPSKSPQSLGPVVLAQLNYGTFLSQRLEEKLSGSRLMSRRLLLQSVLRYVPHWSPQSCGSSRMRAVFHLLGSLRRFVSDVSACCHQVDVRLEQAIILPRHIPRLYHSTVPTTSEYISFYVQFWNTVWLILNDITIGMALGTFLCENSPTLARFLAEPMQAVLVQFPRDVLLWLNNWPAGLKLNTELSQVYCHSLLGIVLAWSRILEQVLFPSLPNLLYVAGALGTCGMTMTISMLSDLLSCFTAHLYVCYRASAIIFSYQLSIAGSLWNLFRGKRNNILRNRKDAWDYDVDQLLLGTMLFTLVAFLSPTTFTYYAFFATARLVVVIIHAALDTILVLMNHFPLFALLLRTKNPLRMPGGVVYRLPLAAPPCLKIQPIAFGRIFDHYVSLGSRLWNHYHPIRLFRMILLGEPLTTIPRPLIRLPFFHVDKSQQRRQMKDGREAVE